MIEALESLLNRYVGGYLLLVVLGQVAAAFWVRRRRARIRRRRRRQGLDDTVLIDHSVRLSELRREAIAPALTLLATVLLGPFVIVALAALAGAPPSGEEKEAMVLVLLGLVLWLLWSGTNVARAFLGGLAFKTLVAVKHPLQVGDRVTLKGVTGKLTDIGIFFVVIRVGGGNLVSIPTDGLWSEVLVSLNAGGRSSRCVMHHYLSPAVTREQRQAAEDALWDAMQASPYLEPSRPIQVLISQRTRVIVLTAKAFAASTYEAPRFESDVARAFLDRCADEGIPLPSPCDAVD